MNKETILAWIGDLGDTFKNLRINREPYVLDLDQVMLPWIASSYDPALLPALIVQIKRFCAFHNFNKPRSNEPS